MDVGVCYFPEHWPREEWERDVKAMAEAGLEYVRMGEFAWSRYEPEPGEYDFEWLEEAVDLVADHGMEAVLCTPTAAPPKWLVDEYPGILPQQADGTVRKWGGRRHYCFNSPDYRRETERIVTAMAEHFADHPHVAGWQTDNEYGDHRCYCPDCASAFRSWLRERYEDVDELNEAWGNAFWSQEYLDFEEIEPPREPAWHHPTRLLEFYRFASDSVVDYNRLQTDLLREANPDWFVTHNFMHNFGGIDTYDICEDLDFASWDSYPTGHVQFHRGEAATEDHLRAGDPDLISFNHSLYDNAAPDPFWIMEQQPGGVNWPPTPTYPADGAMTLWAHHATAHGADVVAYFRWRRARGGQEQYHAGLRTKAGDPDRGELEATRAADEIAALGADGSRTGEPDDEPAPVAFLHDYENLWGLEIDDVFEDFDYWRHAITYYAALRRHGVPVDVLPTDADLAAYDAVVAPTLYLLEDDLADRLTAYVEGGGHLLTTVRTGMKDRYDTLHDAQPGPLADLVGATVTQYECFRSDDAPTVDDDGTSYAFRTWGEWLAPDAGDPVAVHEGGPADGSAAVVRNAVGDGTATYVGVWPEERLANDLVTDLLERADVPHTGTLPDGVRVAARDGLTWVCNFTSDPVAVEVPEGATWELGGSEVDPFDVGVTTAAVPEVDVAEREGDR